jgi:hypothetical protein
MWPLDGRVSEKLVEEIDTASSGRKSQWGSQALSYVPSNDTLQWISGSVWLWDSGAVRKISLELCTVAGNDPYSGSAVQYGSGIVRQ